MQQQESSEKQGQSEGWKQTAGSSNENNDGDTRPRGSRRGRGGQTRGADRGGKYGDNQSRTYNNRSNYGAREGEESRNFNEPAEADRAYNEKPMMRGGRGNYRGRPDFKESRGNRGGFEGSYTRGRGGPSRGGRGRGNRNPNYEVAGPVEDEDVNSDEEVVYLEASELDFVENMKNHVAKVLNGIITEEQVVRICVDEKFDEDKINKILSSYAPDKKYEGCKDYQWQTPMSRQEKTKQFKDQVLAKIEKARLYKETQKQREENKRIWEEKKKQQSIRRAKIQEEKAQRAEERAAIEEQQRQQEHEQAEQAAEALLAEKIEQAEAETYGAANEAQVEEDKKEESEQQPEQVESPVEVQAEKKSKGKGRKERQNRKKAEEEPVVEETQEQPVESTPKAKNNKKKEDRAAKKPKNSKAGAEQQWVPKEVVQEDNNVQEDSVPTEQNEELEANLSAQVAEIVDEAPKESIKETKPQQQAPKHEETPTQSHSNEQTQNAQPQMPQMSMPMMNPMGGQMPVMQMPGGGDGKPMTQEQYIQMMQYTMQMQQQQLAMYQQMIATQFQSNSGAQANPAAQGNQPNMVPNMQMFQGMQQMPAPQFMNQGNFMNPSSQSQGNTPGQGSGRQGQH